jgi:hypothetical protein
MSCPRSRIRTAMLFTLSALSAGAALHCGVPDQPPPADTGQVVLGLAEVPADVGCLRITAAGTDRTLEREVDVDPGKPFSLTLAGVPLGTVHFNAAAFAAACSTVTASTIPTWASDEVTAAIVLGRQSTISLTLHRNGRAKINADFADEPLCTATGATCVSSSQCCSKTCSKGLCAEEGGGSGNGGASGAGGATGDEGDEDTGDPAPGGGTGGALASPSGTTDTSSPTPPPTS